MFKNVILYFLIFLSAIFFSLNSQIIDIRFLPEGSNTFYSEISAPAYVIMLAFTALGLLIGVLFEFSRTWKDRRVSRKKLREVEKLNAQVKYLTNKGTSEADEILGLLK
mgnify:CR=1 FL=1